MFIVGADPKRFVSRSGHNHWVAQGSESETLATWRNCESTTRFVTVRLVPCRLSRRHGKPEILHGSLDPSKSHRVGWKKDHIQSSHTHTHGAPTPARTQAPRRRMGVTRLLSSHARRVWSKRADFARARPTAGRLEGKGKRFRPTYDHLALRACSAGQRCQSLAANIGRSTSPGRNCRRGPRAPGEIRPAKIVGAS